MTDPITAGATWITSPEHRTDGTTLPVLATSFTVPEGVTSVRLDLACLGVLHLTIDGEPASADVLEPGYADWSREAEYVSWDITASCPPGEHVLMAELGGGMYRSRPDEQRWVKVTTDFGDIALAAVIEMTTATGTTVVRSDSAWRASTGPTTHSGFIGGEDFDDAFAAPSTIEEWGNAVAAVVPDVELIAKTTPPIRVVDRYPARSVTTVGEAFVVDFGVNAAGWCVIDLPPHAQVLLRPAELLLADGGVDVRTQGWGPVFHRVRTADRPLTWRPRFMYVGMRYLEVTGLQELTAQDVRFEVLAAGAATSGAFECRDERLNAICEITERAIRSNMFSVFTDCPQREKLGYNEQIHLLYRLLVRTFACEPILDRMLEHAIASVRPDGSIGLFAPEWQDFGDPWRGDPNWGGVVVELAHARYADTGDRRHLERAFDAMVAYTQFLLDDRDDDGILRYGLGDFNGASVKAFRSVPFVSTASLHRLLLRAADAATILGRAADSERLTAAASEVAQAFVREFSLDDAGVAERVFAVHAGLASREQVRAINDLIVADRYVLDVGEVAMAHLVTQLAEAGHHDTLLEICRVTDAPSYGYMLAHGATTLTETWDGPTFGFSQNHFMNGAIGMWFHEYILGIRQAPGSTGWQRPLIAPTPVGSVTSASGWYDAPTGRIAVSWEVVEGVMTVEGSAPKATLRFPSGHEHDVAGDFRLRVALS